MNKIKMSKAEIAFQIFNYVFMVCMIFIMLYPLWHVLMASISDARLLSAHSGLLLHPEGFSLNAYRLMMKNPMIVRGYINTLIILVVGLSINMFVTMTGAYGLSRKNVFWNKYISIFVIFTMYFSGGMIPTYINIKNLGLENTLWAVILPVAVNTFNLIVMRTGFDAIPDSLEEAALIDGAGHLRILFVIMIPLAKATISVIALYYAVSHWNSWFNAMLYLTDRQLYPIQLILREILIQNDTSIMTMSVSAGDSSFVSETIKYAVIIVSVIPIICVYPFLQKYFASGIMIGAVKG